MESRKKVMREIIDFSNNYSVERGLKHVQDTVEGLMDDFRNEDNALVRSKLSEHVVSNTKFLMEVSGAIQTNNQPMMQQVLPNPVQGSGSIDAIEAISFDEED